MKNESRNDPVLGTLAGKLGGVFLQNFVEDLNKNYSEEQLLNYYAVSAEPAYEKSLERALGINKLPLRGTPPYILSPTRM